MRTGSNAFVSVRGEDNLEVGRLPAEEVPLDYPDMPWRADPATGRTSDGRLFSAMFERLFISDDEGRAWRPRPIRFDGFGGCSGFGVQTDDTLLLLYNTPASEQGVRGIAVARSADGSESWEPGEPLDTSSYTGPPDTDGNKFCALPDGTVIVAVCLRNGTGITDYDGTELPPEQQSIRDFVYRSTDGGETWGDRALLVEDSSESNFLSLGGSRVMAAIRRQRVVGPGDPPQSWQRAGANEPPINKVLFLADSDDGGRTWTDVRQLTKLPGDCPGELVRLSDGRIVAIYSHRYPYGHGDTSALVSNDEGKSWSKERYIVSIGSGYSGSVVLEDDTIVTVCGNTQLNDIVAVGVNVQNSNAEPWRAHAVRWRLPG